MYTTWISLLVAGSVLMMFAYADAKRRVLSRTDMFVLGLEPVAAARPAKSAAGNLLRHLARFQSFEEIQTKIERADLARKIKPEEFFGLKLGGAAVACVPVGLVGLVGGNKAALTAAVILAALGFLMPDLWLGNRIETRKKEVRTGLLDWVDLMSVACEAGLNLSRGVLTVAEHSDSLVSREFAHAVRQSELGRRRSEALKEIAERYDVPELATVISAIVQAEERGTPLAAVLRDTAAGLRQMRKLQAQELAQKASVKILIPVILFMFVPMALLLVGPALAGMLASLGL